jgi:hypothetical protein
MVRKKARECPFGHVQNIQYQSSVSGQLKEYFGGSKGERAIAYALLEVTSPEAALTENE